MNNNLYKILEDLQILEEKVKARGENGTYTDEELKEIINKANIAIETVQFELEKVQEASEDLLKDDIENKI